MLPVMDRTVTGAAQPDYVERLTVVGVVADCWEVATIHARLTNELPLPNRVTDSSPCSATLRIPFFLEPLVVHVVL